MTTLTPQQIRELADRAQDWSNRAGTKHKPGQTLAEFAAALRTAADQFEAVQATLDRYAVTDEYNPGMEWTEPEDVWRLFRDLRAILTADTAPQEDRDE